MVPRLRSSILPMFLAVLLAGTSVLSCCYNTASAAPAHGYHASAPIHGEGMVDCDQDQSDNQIECPDCPRCDVVEALDSAEAIAFAPAKPDVKAFIGSIEEHREPARGSDASGAALVRAPPLLAAITPVSLQICLRL